MAGANSPTVRRRELGTVLRALRTDAGLTVDQVAERLLCSPSKVSRLETGQRGASLRDVRDLCDLYEVSVAERDRLMTLAREGKQQAWWQPFDLPYATYVGLEAEARSIVDFNSGVVTGLLQTREYALALHEAIVPELSRELIDQRIEARMIRQQRVLTGNVVPQLTAIMDEAVLHRLVGGEEVMRAQLGRLLEVSEWPNVTIRVLPYRVGAHSALESTFAFLEFEAPVSAVVYVDGLVGQIYLEHQPDVQRYEQVIGQLRTLSLSEQDSAELIAGVHSAC